MRPIVFKSRSMPDFTGYAILVDFECFWMGSLTFAPTERKKAPSSWPLPGSSALQWVFSPSGTKSRPADGSLYPSCCGCQAVGLWRAAAAADSALSDWPLVRDRAVDHNGLRLCLFRHESTRWGGSQRHSRYWAQPSWPSILLPTISLPPGTGHSRFLSLPTLLLSEARALSHTDRSSAPAVYLLRVLEVTVMKSGRRWGTAFPTILLLDS